MVCLRTDTGEKPRCPEPGTKGKCGDIVREVRGADYGGFIGVSHKRLLFSFCQVRTQLVTPSVKQRASLCQTLDLLAP